MASTRSRPTSGRGGLSLTVSALGLALAVSGGVATARSADGSLRAGEGSRASLPPYTVAPAVRFEAANPPGPPRTTPRPPRRLVVPRLGIDAKVVGVEAPGGVLLPPADPQVLGWWRSGARPGAVRGSALITGHTVSSGGGAFDDLERLRRGDRVRVRTAAGSLLYEVSGVRIYRKAGLARDAAELFSQSVPGRLVLVTCEDWNGTTYLSNAVVVAEPVP
ncbi:class F sortase [Nocardioides pakistanensis]